MMATGPENETKSELSNDELGTRAEHFSHRLLLLKPDEYGSGKSESSSEPSSAGSEKDLRDDEHDCEEAGIKRGRKPSCLGASKRARTLLSPEQSRVLHELLQQTCFPSTKVRESVAAKLGLSPRKVQVFFQNKRQKQRKKSNSTRAAQQTMMVPMYSQGIQQDVPIEEDHHYMPPMAHKPPTTAPFLYETTPPKNDAITYQPVAREPRYQHYSHSAAPDGWTSQWASRQMDSEIRVAPIHHPMLSYRTHHDYRQPNYGREYTHTIPEMKHSLYQSYYREPTRNNTSREIMYGIAAPAAPAPTTQSLPPIGSRDYPKPKRMQLPSINELMSVNTRQ